MERLRRVWKLIFEQLGRLTPSQKLLIGALAVVAVMTLLLVSQYAGNPKMVPLVVGGTPEDQQRIADFLETRGEVYLTQNGRISVPAERQYALLAQLQQASALPADKKLLFPSLFDGQSWMRSRGELDQRYTIALCNELAKVICEFSGIVNAAVIVSNPEPRGLGQTARRPTAQVTVFTQGTAPLDQPTVDALADLVAGSVAGLEPADVRIVDGTNRRRYRAGAAGDFSASTYLEQAAKVEERVQSKIVEHLTPFIPNVIVSVNAIVDASRRESKTDSVLAKGEGSQSMTLRESGTTTVSTESAGAAEPGPGSNVQMDISRAGGAGRTSNTSETSDTEFENFPGRKTVMQLDPQGKPLKINVSVSVPKDYVTAILSQKAAGSDPAGGAAAAPSDDEVDKAWVAERTRIEGIVRPLIETETSAGAASPASAGNLVVSLIPVAMLAPGAAGSGVGGGGGGGLLGGGAGLLANGLVKQVALGGLAAVALGLMLLMVKKASKPAMLPTAEELVGVPPALEPGSDLIGEAAEGETAMVGIEVNDDELKTSKMLEQVAELVKANPNGAANIFGKWLTPEG